MYRLRRPWKIHYGFYSHVKIPVDIQTQTHHAGFIIYFHITEEAPFSVLILPLCLRWELCLMPCLSLFCMWDGEESWFVVVWHVINYNANINGWRGDYHGEGLYRYIMDSMILHSLNAQTYTHTPGCNGVTKCSPPQSRDTITNPEVLEDYLPKAACPNVLYPS